MAVLAVAALGLGVGSLLVIGGVIVAPFLFGLFGLALVGVLGGLDERTVRQHDPVLSPRGWREGSVGGVARPETRPQRDGDDTGAVVGGSRVER